MGASPRPPFPDECTHHSYAFSRGLPFPNWELPCPGAMCPPIQVHSCIYTQKCMHTWTHRSIRACVCACMHMYIHAHRAIYVFVYMHMCTRSHTHACKHTHIHIPRAHACTHTHTPDYSREVMASASVVQFMPASPALWAQADAGLQLILTQLLPLYHPASFTPLSLNPSLEGSDVPVPLPWAPLLRNPT